MARTDTAFRLIDASPAKIYQAFVDPAALVSWLPPKGMKAQLTAFDPRPGGGYRMVLSYEHAEHAAAGKSSEGSDVVEARFVELRADEQVVQEVVFESDDPAFAGVMTMTWSLTTTSDGTEVRIVAENVPVGIRREDHEAGMSSSLDNLAAFCGQQ